MIKKELREIIVPGLIRLSVFMIPVIAILIVKIITRSNIDILVTAASFWGVGIYWAANHYGTQLFKSEFNDRALEYLLTLPYSKYRLIYNKLLPRFFVLLWLTFVYEFLACAALLGPDPSAIFFMFPFRPDYFLVGLLFFFFWGFCLGFIESRNRRATLNFILFVFYMAASVGFTVILNALGAKKAVQGTMSSLYAALFIMAILSIPLFSLFKKFDLKRINLYGKRILYRLLPPIIIFSSITAFMIVKFGVR